MAQVSKGERGDRRAPVAVRGEARGRVSGLQALKRSYNKKGTRPYRVVNVPTGHLNQVKSNQVVVNLAAGNKKRHRLSRRFRLRVLCVWSTKRHTNVFIIRNLYYISYTQATITWEKQHPALFANLFMMIPAPPCLESLVTL